MQRSYIHLLTISRVGLELSTPERPFYDQRWNFRPLTRCFALRCGKICDNCYFRMKAINAKGTAMAIDDKTRTELEAAVFRRLVEHLRGRTDVQNIELMNLAGFCRNCLSNWMKDAADAKGANLTKDESREAVYGMPYEEWKAKHQGAAMP